MDLVIPPVDQSNWYNIERLRTTDPKVREFKVIFFIISGTDDDLMITATMMTMVRLNLDDKVNRFIKVCLQM